MPGENGKNSRRRPGPAEKDRPRVSRENVLGAARRIFAALPYSAASIRMIGKEGGFDHSLIHYYFPTKAALFEAVIAEIANELYLANKQWYEGLDGSNPREEIAIHADRIIEFDLLHPEPLKILFMNMSELHRYGDLPGFQLVQAILQGTQDTFKEMVAINATDDEVVRLNRVFANAVVNFIGGSQVQAMLIGMDPKSRQYREWVRETMVQAFLPWVEGMLRKPGNIPENS